MTLRYSLIDAQEWREFSGDNNPLHFTHVKPLTVHGMRALLDIQNALHHAGQTDCETALAQRFIARLHAPLFCDTNYTLQQLSPDGKKWTIADEQQQRCINARLSEATSLPDALPEVYFPLSKQQMGQFSEQYLFPLESSASWVFTSALLFRLLLTDPQLNTVLQSQTPQLAGTPLCQLLHQRLVRQTHHEVIFSPAFSHLLPELLAQDAIFYGLYPPTIIGDLKESTTVSIKAIAWYQQQYLKISTTLKIDPLESYQ
jgi:hypothetical protein